MGKDVPGRRRCRGAGVALVVAVAGAAVAGCAGERGAAAPVILKGAGMTGMNGIETAPIPPSTMARPSLPSPPSPLPGPGKRIVVRPGQSVGKLAREYGVSKHAIIETNRLQPPYKIEIGQRLAIPGAAVLPVREGVKPAEAPEHRQIAAAKAPRSEPARSTPEIIPLDGSEPASSPIASPPAALRPPAAAAPPHIAFPPASSAGSIEPPPRSAEPRSAEAAPPDAQSTKERHLLWPVRGRVVAGYGDSQGRGHNDGINIAAPRGAAVRAVESGTVAYAGNEIRGYGNLVLIKHPDGFISAYAHADELLVKRGDKVGRGQVIAKVGDTGGVGEPQLHFELRRGKRAVDPREFLAPASSAGAAAEKKRS